MPRAPAQAAAGLAALRGLLLQRPVQHVRRFVAGLCPATAAGDPPGLREIRTTRLRPPRNDVSEPLPLRPPEQNILQLIGEGTTTKGIARELNVTPATVKTRVKNIFHKLNVSSRNQVVSKYYRCGLETAASRPG